MKNTAIALAVVFGFGFGSLIGRHPIDLNDPTGSDQWVYSFQAEVVQITLGVMEYQRILCDQWEARGIAARCAQAEPSASEVNTVLQRVLYSMGPWQTTEKWRGELNRKQLEDILDDYYAEEMPGMDNYQGWYHELVGMAWP